MAICKIDAFFAEMANLLHSSPKFCVIRSRHKIEKTIESRGPNEYQPLQEKNIRKRNYHDDHQRKISHHVYICGEVMPLSVLNANKCTQDSFLSLSAFDLTINYVNRNFLCYPH